MKSWNLKPKQRDSGITLNPIGAVIMDPIHCDEAVVAGKHAHETRADRNAILVDDCANDDRRSADLRRPTGLGPPYALRQCNDLGRAGNLRRLSDLRRASDLRLTCDPAGCSCREHRAGHDSSCQAHGPQDQRHLSAQGSELPLPS